ncbi:MAG: hypothetical protein JOZ69_01395, partial [Myxococcales bacterium]|nr:hypothetical protein [Myxococcales bacterium]
MRTKVLDAVAPWAAGLVLAMPVLVAFYPPMTDLPLHEAAIGILRHFDERAMFPPGLYLHNFGEPNQLFHMLGWALSYAVSTRWAVKLLVAAAVLAIPPSAASLARHLGASGLAAVIVSPMALGWLFSWGLVTNLLGLACLLWVLPALDRYSARPTFRGAIANLGAVALLYFAHEAMLFVYGLFAALLVALAPGSLRRATARLVPLVAIAGVHTASIRRQARFLTPAVRSIEVIWHPLAHKLVRIPQILLPAHDFPLMLGTGGLCLLALASFVRLRARERASEPAPGGDARADAGATAVRGGGSAPHPSSRLGSLRSALVARRFELLGVACLVAYFVMPFSLAGATLVYHRFLPPAFVVIALAAAPRDLWVSTARITRVTLGVLPVATLFVAWPSFADAGREHARLERILPLIEPGSAVAAIQLGSGDPTRTFSLGSAGGRVLATRGGRLSYAFTDSPISPVVIARRYQWNESLVRLGFRPWDLRPAHDLKLFQYLL